MSRAKFTSSMIREVLKDHPTDLKTFKTLCNSCAEIIEGATVAVAADITSVNVLAVWVPPHLRGSTTIFKVMRAIKARYKGKAIGYEPHPSKSHKFLSSKSCPPIAVFADVAGGSRHVFLFGEGAEKNETVVKFTDNVFMLLSLLRVKPVPGVINSAFMYHLTDVLGVDLKQTLDDLTNNIPDEGDKDQIFQMYLYHLATVQEVQAGRANDLPVDALMHYVSAPDPRLLVSYLNSKEAKC